MKVKRAGDTRKPRVILHKEDIEALKEIPRCQNPECNKQIPHEKLKHNPNHCSHKCWLRHMEINRGKCERIGCTNYKKHAGHKYCSDECYMMVIHIPRGQCQRPGCTNIVKQPRGKYCSVECRDQCIDMTELSKKGNEVARRYREATGHIIKYEKRASAVSRNNRSKPPKSKVHREDIVYGYKVIFDPDGSGGYRAVVPDVAGIITHNKTKKGAMTEIKKLLRKAGVDPNNRPNSRMKGFKQ